MLIMIKVNQTRTVVAPMAKAMKSVTEVTVMVTPAYFMARPKRSSRGRVDPGPSMTFLNACVITNMSSIP